MPPALRWKMSDGTNTFQLPQCPRHRHAWPPDAQIRTDAGIRFLGRGSAETLRTLLEASPQGLALRQGMHEGTGHSVEKKCPTMNSQYSRTRLAQLGERTRSGGRTTVEEPRLVPRALRSIRCAGPLRHLSNLRRLNPRRTGNCECRIRVAKPVKLGPHWNPPL